MTSGRPRPPGPRLHGAREGERATLRERLGNVEVREVEIDPGAELETAGNCCSGPFFLGDFPWV